MELSKPGIVFMGTPEFAVPSLEILVRSEFSVKAVVTAVDKPAGRGLKVRESAVKIAAVENGIPVLQPPNLKDDEFAGKLRELAADLFVVVAFRMLPEKVWGLPPMGTINLHASLLPSYRGAAPINHAIINGERYTGVTTFLIEKEIDKGNILLQEQTEIGDQESAGELHDRLMVLGADLLMKTVTAMSAGKIQSTPQDKISLPENLPKAPKIAKDDCKIDWSGNLEKVYNFIRGLSPYPAAWTTMVSGGRVVSLKIIEAVKIAGTHPYSSGRISIVDDSFIIDAADGSILVKRMQAEGRKVMSGSDFIRGFRPGDDTYCR